MHSASLSVEGLCIAREDNTRAIGDFLTNLRAANKLLRMVEALPRSQSAISQTSTWICRAERARDLR